MISSIRSRRNISVLEADMPTQQYEELKKEVEEKNRLLVESALRFSGKLDTTYTHCINFEDMDPRLQFEYVVPFCDSQYERKSTIATAGSAILVAKFIEHVFMCKEVSIEELAKLTVEKGYRGYQKQENGTYKSMGCKHLFFDRFLPSLYEDIEVERASDVSQLFDSLWEYKIPVLLVKNSIYKWDYDSEDSHFVALLGYDENGVKLYDPDHIKYYYKPFNEVIPALRAAWIVGLED